jgi:UDP-N-acetylglucosamine transferase subunit ALG13
VTATDDVPLVLVVTGTDKHPFDRLVDWTDDWLRARTGSAVRCLVQYGNGHAPEVADGSAFLDHAALEVLMSTSTVIVSHGGPTTISEARRLGHRPLVVPRRSALGEHVDDHQVRFTTHLACSGLVEHVESACALAEAVERALRQGAPEVRDAVESAAAESAATFAGVVEDVLSRHTRRLARRP